MNAAARLLARRLIACSLVLGLPGLASAAPIQRERKAPVVLDGRVLFEVGPAGRSTAVDRARLLSTRLRREARSADASSLDGASQDEMVMLRLGGTHLLTVTATDPPMGRSVDEQAQLWLLDIEQALAQAKTERSGGYLQRAAGLSLIAILLGVALHWFLWRLGRRLPVLFARRSVVAGRNVVAPPFWRTTVQVIVVLLQMGVWVVAAEYITDLFPAARQARYDSLGFVQMALTAPMLTLDQKSYSLLDFVWLLGLVVLLWLGVSLLVRIIKGRLVRSGANRGVLEPVAVFVQYALTFVGLVIILQVAGLNLSSLTFVASVLGVGIGFGLQNIANNFVSGIIIAFERPVQVGDFIQLGDLYGTVERVGNRSTEIQTLDRVAVIVPNSRLLEHEVVNWSHGDPLSRVHVKVGVAYGSDLKRARAVLLDAAKGHPDVMGEPRPDVRLERFGDSALELDLLVWTRLPRGQFELRSDLNYRIEAGLRRAGIQIPFPQRTLHVNAAEIGQIAAAWARAPARDVELYNPNGARVHEPPAVVMVEEYEAPPDGVGSSALAAVDIDRIVATMRRLDGLDIRDRRHLLSVYRRCFVGSEAVEWMVRAQQLTRDQAVRVGQALVERGVIHHVLDEHPFRDGHFYYRFYEDEGAARGDDERG